MALDRTILRTTRESSEYVANRIRKRVNDPVVAEKLIPRDHGFGVQRVPMETNYFEAYNRANVHLVDISETPIERITPKRQVERRGRYVPWPYKSWLSEPRHDCRPSERLRVGELPSHDRNCSELDDQSLRIHL
jgi:cation diffusion facilitator CzcD-associated flavoprotein CzcO